MYFLFLGLEFNELFLIMLIAVVIFGPKKIPEIARSFGHAIRQMREATDNIKSEIMKPVDEIKKEVSIKDSFTSVSDEIIEAKKEMETHAEEVAKTFRSIPRADD